MSHDLPDSDWRMADVHRRRSAHCCCAACARSWRSRPARRCALDKLVAVIAANMVAEVCSIYLRRAGKMLELFATEGLNRAAVHRTRLREGEGLVGLVAETAEPVNLTDAPADPHFSYRPETGEDPYQALFSACPSCAAARSTACSRCRTGPNAIYAEEEVEALQTVAMVLAEVVAQGGLFDIAELDEPELARRPAAQVHGRGPVGRRRGRPRRAARAAREGRAHDRRRSGRKN